MALEQNHRTESEWLKIERDFLSSDMTLDEFATAKDIPKSTIYKHSTKKNWLKKREAQFKENIQSGKIKFDTECLELTGLAMQNIRGMLPNSDEKETAGMIATIEKIQAIKYRIWDIQLPKQLVENTDAPPTPRDGLKDKLIEQIRDLQPEDFDDNNAGYLEVNYSNTNGNPNGNGATTHEHRESEDPHNNGIND